MTNADRFEAELAARLQSYATARPIEELEVARAAISTARSRSWTSSARRFAAIATEPMGIGSHWGAWRRAWTVAIVGLLLLAIVATAILVGNSLVPPLVVAPSQSAGPLATRTDGPILVEPTQPPGPWAGTFESTGRPNLARSDATALLLLDGRVLVLGGDPVEPELYDPATGTFTRIDPIAPELGTSDHPLVSYDGFSATVLADGRVLVAGGRILTRYVGLPPTVTGAGAQATAEAVIFDPATRSVTPTGVMTTPRVGHLAVRLVDGRVLIAGGVVSSADEAEVSTGSAEIYDPTTGQFRTTASMAADRASVHQSDTALVAISMPSGRVLISGGESYQPDAPGSGEFGPVADPDEIFDPATETFTRVPSDVTPEDRTVIVLLDDHVYRADLITGTRIDITPEPAELVRLYGTDCRDVTDFGCRSGMTLTLIGGGRVLIAGGMRTTGDQADHPGSSRVTPSWAEVFDTGSGAVLPTGPLVEPKREYVAVALADGRVLLIGSDAAELFTPS